MVPYLHAASGRRYIQPPGQNPMHYARWLWEQEHGPLDPGWDVHHVNLDRLDDRLENLVALPRAEHQRLHAETPIPYTCVDCGFEFEQRGGRPRRRCPDCKRAADRESMRRTDARRLRSVEAICQFCGAAFLTRNGRFCSQRCVNLGRSDRVRPDGVGAP